MGSACLCTHSTGKNILLNYKNKDTIPRCTDIFDLKLCYFGSYVYHTQAARLTSKCRQLRRLGLQVRSRPFIYSDTPQLDLDSFLQYTNSTRYTVSNKKITSTNGNYEALCILIQAVCNNILCVYH